MKKIRKIIVSVLLFSFVLQNSFLGFTFAEDKQCTACSRTTNEMQMYINFQVEIISELRKAEGQRDDYTGWTKKGLFSYGTVKVGTNIVNSLKQSMNKVSQSSVDIIRSAEIAAFVSMKNATLVAAGEGFGDMLILVRKKPFLRDWMKLQEIDSTLDDLARDLGMQGLLNKTISNDILQQISEVSEKYIIDKKGDNQMFEIFKIDGNATYSDVISELSVLNLLMKNFFTVESIFVFRDKIKTYTELKNLPVMKYKFNDVYLENLSNSYVCVRNSIGFKNCESSILDFASDIVGIGEEIKQSFESSINEIEESSIKLAQSTKAIGKIVKNKYSKSATDLGLTEEQLELLSDVYGINAYKLNQQQGFSISTLFNGKFLKNLKNSISFSFDDFDMEIQKQKKESKKSKNKNMKCLNWSTASKKKKKRYCEKVIQGDFLYCNDLYNCEQLSLNWNDISSKISDIDEYLEFYVSDVSAFTGLIDYLNYNINEVFGELEKDEEVIMYSLNNSTTRYFVEVGSNIHDMIENVIGTKDLPKSIVGNLGGACDKQCTNKGGDCFYQ